MKKYYKVLIVLLFVFAIVFAAYSFTTNKYSDMNKEQNLQQTKNASISDEDKLCCSEIEGANEYSENSLYQLESDWKNEFGKTVKLSSFKGEKVILAMFFSSCTYACPLIVNDMRKIESKLNESEKKNIKFVLVSIDPERDLPEALKIFGQRQNLDFNKWELLTGTESKIRELAALLGFKYVKEKDGSFSHSNLINFLNIEGEIVYQHEGLNKDVEDIIENIRSTK